MAKKEKILDDLDEQLKKLEEELNRIDEDPRAYYEEMLKDDFEKGASKFRTILNEGKDNLSKLRKIGEDELVNVKDNVKFTGKALRQSFNYFRSQFKNRKKQQTKLKPPTGPKRPRFDSIKKLISPPFYQGPF